jgi:hypothetical protein
MVINFKIYVISRDMSKLAGHHVKLKKKKTFLHRQWLLPLHSSHMTMVLTTVKTNKASNHCVRV